VNELLVVVVLVRTDLATISVLDLGVLASGGSTAHKPNTPLGHTLRNLLLDDLHTGWQC
jgi:hypothetical protein